jgi:type IV pilus assembly protein PilV
MMTHHSDSPSRDSQSGFMLLEALIAILIFSLGILAIVALQAVSIKLTEDAKYRSDAALLAEELLGQIWVSDRIPANMSATFATGANACTALAAGVAGAAAACTACTADATSAACISYPTYATWLANVRNALPGTATNPPTVIVDTTSGTATTGTTTVTVLWQGPNDGLPHSHAVTAQIR